MKPINKSVFRAYDIRGVVDRDFDPEWVELLGRAVGTWFAQRGWDRAVVGHDTRHSSPEYQRRIAAGLLACGLDVISVGMVSTPVFYYAVKRLGLSAGLVITASHNPPEYNGFKVWGGETTIAEDEIQEIYGIMTAGAFVEGRGVASEHDIVPSYLDELAEQLHVDRPLKVVVDGGNGTSGELTARLLERGGVDVVRLFCEPDGDFPNHHPDPVVEKYTGQLQRAVVEHGAAAGIGLDGDGDRIGVVDETGRLLYGEHLLAILARDALRDSPGAGIIGDVKCSHLLFRDIKAHGGRAIMSRTGHSIIKARMLAENAAIGGEMSGHMFFNDRYLGFDDATYAALRLVNVMGSDQYGGRPLSRYLEDWPKTYNTPEIRMECPDAVKFELVERARAHFAARAGREGFSIIDVDGVRLTFADGWALLRASNTQGALVMRFEAESAERLEAVRAFVETPLLRWMAELGV